jgi:PAS domain S-box-containing protein
MISVLHVDDERVVLDTSKLVLERSGKFSVDTALTAAQALRKFHEAPYDAIISDYRMAEIDGLELLKIIRNEQPDQPFLIFTGKGREEVAAEAYEQGVDFYVQKGGEPLAQFAELAHKIEKAVEKRRMKKQLEESKEQLQNFVRNFEGIAFQSDPQGHFHFLEGKVGEITGYSTEELRTGAVPLNTLIHQDNRPAFEEGLRQLKTLPGFRIDFPLHIIRKDGHSRWLQGIIHNVSLPGENVLYIQGALNDITELKVAQDKIADTEAKWRSITTRAPVIITIMDKKGTILFINKAHSPHSPSHYIGTSVYDYVTPEQKPVLKSALERVFGIGEIMRFEASHCVNDTVEEWFTHQISPITWDAGQQAALVISVVITERKWLEQNLRESEEQYRAIVSASGDGISIISREGRIIFDTPRVYEIFDIPRDRKIIGTSVMEYIDPSFARIAGERIAKILSGDIDSEPYEYQLRKADGTIFTGEIISSPLRDANGEITSILVLIRDISHRKRAGCNIPGK